MQWNSFKPILVQSLMAESAPNFGGAVRKEKQKMLMDDERAATRSENMDANAANQAQMDAARAQQKDRSVMIAPIEGESGPQRMTRLQNQAWDPDNYGDKYRAQFKPLSQSPTQGAAPDPEADAYEKRRRERLNQSRSYLNDTTGFE